MRTLLPILLLLAMAAHTLAATPLTNRAPRQTVDCLITLEIDERGQTRVISDNTLPHASARFYGRMLQALAVNGASWLARFEFRQTVSAIAARTDGDRAWLRADGGQPLALPGDDKDFVPPVSGKSFSIHMSRKPTRVQLIVRGDRIPGYRPAQRPGLQLQREQARDVMARFRQALSSGHTREVSRHIPQRGVTYKKGTTRSQISAAEALGMLGTQRGTSPWRGTSPRMQSSGTRIVIDVPLGSGTRRWTIEDSGSGWTVRQIEDMEFVLPGSGRSRQTQSFWNPPR